MEPDAELLDRYERVKADLARVTRAKNRMKLGSPARMRKARWAGCIQFNLLSIEEEMRERGRATTGHRV